MTRRILPREEYPRLAGTELETVWSVLPEDARVLVVEDDGQIVGCWSLFWRLDAEGVWIHPDYRGRGAVARGLLSMMREQATSMGARAVVTASQDPTVTRLIGHLRAVPLKGEHFAIPLENDTCPQR